MDITFRDAFLFGTAVLGLDLADVIPDLLLLLLPFLDPPWFMDLPKPADDPGLPPLKYEELVSILAPPVVLSSI